MICQRDGLAFVGVGVERGVVARGHGHCSHLLAGGAVPVHVPLGQQGVLGDHRVEPVRHLEVFAAGQGSGRPAATRFADGDAVFAVRAQRGGALARSQRGSRREESHVMSPRAAHIDLRGDLRANSQVLGDPRAVHQHGLRIAGEAEHRSDVCFGQASISNGSDGCFGLELDRAASRELADRSLGVADDRDVVEQFHHDGRSSKTLPSASMCRVHSGPAATAPSCTESCPMSAAATTDVTSTS